MPASRIAHIARIQSKATGQGYQSILSSLMESDDFSNSLPVVPTRAQQQLEALFINRLEILRFKPRGTTTKERFGIQRLHAGPDYVILRLSQVVDLPFLTVQIMPGIDTTAPGEITQVNGIPGLRATEHPLGICLSRPGIEAKIILQGINFGDWERAHHAGFVLPHTDVGCAATNHPEGWTTEEREFVACYGDALVDVASIESTLLRRICLFNVHKPRSVKTWRNHRKGICVEVDFAEFTPHQFDELITMTTSNSLNPAMELQSRYFNAEGNWGRIILRCLSTGQTMEIRTGLA